MSTLINTNQQIDNQHSHQPSSTNVTSEHVAKLASQTLETLIFPEFLEQTENGVFLLPEKLNTTNQLRDTLNLWFWNNLFIAWINIRLLQDMIYKDEEKKAEAGRIRIGDSIEEVPENIRGLFWESIQINDDGKALWNYFHRRDIMDEHFLKKLKTEEERYNRIKDILIAQAWKPGKIRKSVCYGFLEQSILDGIRKQRNVSIIIAIPMIGVRWKDAIMQEVFAKKWIIDSGGLRKKLDQWSINARYVEVWEEFFEKIYPTTGSPGIDVNGLPIPWITGSDIEFWFDSESVDIEKKGDEKCSLIAKTPWYLYIDTLKGGSKYYRVSHKIELRWVGMHSDTRWSVNLRSSSGLIQGDVTKSIPDAEELDIHGNIISESWDKELLVHAQNSIHVHENILWGIKSVADSKTGFVSKHNTSIIANESITVDRNVESSFLVWKTIKVVWYMATSHLNADEISGNRATRNSILFSGNQTKLAQADNCVIISNTIHIENAGDNVTLVVLIPDATEEVKTIEKDIKEEQQLLKKEHTTYEEKLRAFSISAKIPMEKVRALIEQLSIGTVPDTAAKVIKMLVQDRINLRKSEDDLRSSEELLMATRNSSKASEMGVSINIGTISWSVVIKRYSLPTNTIIELLGDEDSQKRFATETRVTGWEILYSVNSGSIHIHGLDQK